MRLRVQFIKHFFASLPFVSSTVLSGTYLKIVKTISFHKEASVYNIVILVDFLIILVARPPLLFTTSLFPNV